jgi:hypothetical protein
MAIAHGFRRTIRLDLDCTAKTASDMAHYFPPWDEQWEKVLLGVWQKRVDAKTVVVRVEPVRRCHKG